MHKKNIDELVEATMQSIKVVKRAEPKPFLLTRVLAALNRQAAVENIWTKAGTFISRPRIAIAAVACILLLNAGIIFIGKNNMEKSAPVQNNISSPDEFAINAGSMYDIENPE